MHGHRLNSSRTTLRQNLFRKLREFGHAFVDSIVADELCNDCTDEVIKPKEGCFPGAKRHAGGADFPALDLGGDVVPEDGFDGPIELGPGMGHKAAEAIRQRIRLRAARMGAPVDPNAVAAAAAKAGLTKSREYPMGLSPDYVVTSLEPFRELIKTDERDGKTVVFMDPIEATPELLAALQAGSSGPRMVKPGETVYITGRPQVMFRPERVSIESELAASFEVVDIKVGKNSQFVSAVAILGEEFASDRRRPPLKLDVAQISMDVTVILRNRTDKPVRAPHVTLYGPAVE